MTKIVGFFLTLVLPLAAFGQVVESSGVSTDLQWRTLSGTVRLNGSGTGAIIARDGDTTYILTAAHCVKDKTKFEVEYFHKACYPKPILERATLVATDEASDIALLKVTKGIQPSHVIPICPGNELPRAGDAVWTVGCGDGKPPYCLVGKLTGEDGNGLRTDYGGIGGFSGSPVLDSRGRLVGIWWGSDTKSGAVVHPELVYQMLDENKMGVVSEWGKHFGKLPFRFIEYMTLAVCLTVLMIRFLEDDRMSAALAQEICGGSFPWVALAIHLLGLGGLIILFTFFIRVPFTIISISVLVAEIWAICYGSLALSGVLVEGFVPISAWRPIAVIYAKASGVSVAVSILCSRGQMQSFWWIALVIPAVTAGIVAGSLFDRLERGGAR
jgi:hypothetical protein